MNFVDAAKLSGTRKTSDGYLVADAFAVRTGIQLYRGSEVDPENRHGLRDRAIVRVYRPEEEVRSVDSLRSFSHAPITLGHPGLPVNDQNWKDLAVGEVSTEATWDGNKIKLPLILKDRRAVELVESGTRELSAGYQCKLVIGDGMTSDGEAYDAKQTNIRINHLAVVPRGRAGAECRIGDDGDAWGAAPMTTVDTKENPMSTKPVVVGDQVVNVAAEDATKLETFLKKLSEDHEKELADRQSKHDKELGMKDAEITKLGDEKKQLEGQVLSDAQIDARAAERSKLIDSAKKLAPNAKLDGLSDSAIRRAVLAARLGEDRIKDKSDDYVFGVFDSLSTVQDKRSADPVVVPPKVLTPHTQDSDESWGFDSYVNNLKDGWKLSSNKEN